MGNRWNRPKHGKTVAARPKRGTGRWPKGGNGENGLNVKNRWNGKKRLSVTVESAESVGKRWPHGQKRGKTVVAWQKWSKTVVAWPETWENGGRTAKTWENGGRTAKTVGKRWHIDGNR